MQVEFTPKFKKEEKLKKVMLSKKILNQSKKLSYE